MKLIVLRHGQTDYNKKGIMQGQEIDVPINDTGRAQMEEAAKLLPAHIDQLLASPLKRTRESAEILNQKYGLTVGVRDAFKELSYGTMAGKTLAQIATITGEATPGERDANATFDYRDYDGESGEELKLRVKSGVDELLATHQDETIVIVTHGGVIAAMHALYHQGAQEEGTNGQIHEFDL